MSKLIKNLVAFIITSTIVLSISYSLAYFTLLSKLEVEKMNMELIPKEDGFNVICDGCGNPKNKLKETKLTYIHQNVLLCEECQIKFQEVPND